MNGGMQNDSGACLLLVGGGEVWDVKRGRLAYLVVRGS